MEGSCRLNQMRGQGKGGALRKELAGGQSGGKRAKARVEPFRSDILRFEGSGRKMKEPRIDRKSREKENTELHSAVRP